MASAGALWGPVALRFLRVAMTSTTKVVRSKIASTARSLQNGIPQVSVRSGHTGRQPIHPAALLKQQKRAGRWFSSTATQQIERTFQRLASSSSRTGTKASRFDRTNPTIARKVAQASGRAPFASTLRPNLTGGAMPRTAGGYSLGGGTRYFSHTPAAPAQVVQNVSQAMRAFFLSGQKLRYDGLGPRGERQYRAVSKLEDEAMDKFRACKHAMPGAFIDFKLSPTVTALSPLAAAIAFSSGATSNDSSVAAVEATLNAEGFLDGLSADFDRALKDLAIVFSDIRRLAVLGNLPVALEGAHTLRVHFPGVDGQTVERLCDDIGIQRGVIGQDPGFDAAAGVPMALKFPFAPDSERTITSPGGSARSLEGHEFENLSSLGDDSFVQDAFMDEMANNPWMSDVEGYESASPPTCSQSESENFEGLEGIYRFLEECDRAKHRYH
ncbi:hypothetical protein HJFPF1_00819 [Paramyrothecium foliicola]|nr:hypothetical protein HJFPF1_00819 [Paramyrothecium foliicola]